MLIAPPAPLKPNMLAALRIAPGVQEETVKVQSVPRIHKPGRQTFFRTYPDETAWASYFTYSPEGEFDAVFLVVPAIASQLGSLALPQRLVPSVTLEGDLFFWPLKIPNKPNSWSDSAHLIAGEAMTEWRRMAANLVLKRYDAWKPRLPKPDPTWPTPDELEALMLKAIDGRIIDSLDHPEIAKLF